MTSPWRKFVDDLSSTRIQITYAVMAPVVAAMVKAVLLIKAISDVPVVLAAFFPLASAVLAAWGFGKWVESKQANGP